MLQCHFIKLYSLLFSLGNEGLTALEWVKKIGEDVEEYWILLKAQAEKGITGVEECKTIISQGGWPATPDTDAYVLLTKSAIINLNDVIVTRFVVCQI